MLPPALPATRTLRLQSPHVRHRPGATSAPRPLPAARRGAAGRPGAARPRARLAPVPIDVAMQATIAGQGTATATLSGTTLSVEGELSGTGHPGHHRACLRERADGHARHAGRRVRERRRHLRHVQGHRDALASAQSAAFEQGPALRADPERESARRQPVGMADATEGTTLMTRPRTRHAWFTAAALGPLLAALWIDGRAGGDIAGDASADPGRLLRGASGRRPRPLPGPLRRLSPRRPGRPQRRAAAGRRHLLRRVAGPDHARAGRVHPRLDAAGRPAARRRRRRSPSPPSSWPATAPLPGATALTADAAAPVGSVATGAATSAAPTAGAPAPAEPRSPATRRRAPPGRGCRRAPPGRRRAATTWSARCRATPRSPTRCCARRRPATG